VDEIKQSIRWLSGYSYAQYKTKVKNTWTKKNLLDYIKKAFDNAFQIDPKPYKTILYYSGEADENGHWKCSDGSISIAEVLNLAVEVELNGHLDIHSDSDYSGKLAYEAKEWCDQNPRD
tara:strand:+ start:167 stop:523 length:357 start_codon:yes stop_codon:yes gene_type:complete